jgi:homoserine kinase type II
MKVFLLEHVHELPDGREDVKLIGVYSSQERAEEAKQRVLAKPGFQETPDGFSISRCAVDEDHWTDGYTSLVEEDGSVWGDLPAWFCRNGPPEST